MYLSSYNLSRSILATGTLLTLLFNNNYTLFGFEITHYNNLIYDNNLFYVLKNHLILAKSISILVLILVISGYFPRITGILHWYITYSFFLSCDVIDGGDHIASNLTLLLIPITLLDNRKNHWQKETAKKTFQIIIRNIFFLLISIQVCAIYLHAFVGKLAVEEWINGTAVYYWFTHNHFGVSPSLLPITKNILSNNIIVTLLTWGTLLLEFFLSACIILNKKDNNRYLFLLLGMFFHLSIIFIHGLISFYFTMASALILYLIPSNLTVNYKTFKFKKIWTKILKQY
jgi:antimicrobial peptide system SdpB family protein